METLSGDHGIKSKEVGMEFKVIKILFGVMKTELEDIKMELKVVAIVFGGAEIE